MSKTTALDTLVELTQGLLNRAGVALANSRKSEKQARDFMNTLLGYRADYTIEMQRLMLTGMDAMTIGNYRVFLGSLDSAIQQANNTVKDLEQVVNSNQASWQDHHMKINAYETLIDRRAKVLMVKNSRLDQRQTDEISSQMRVRQSSNALSTPGF